MFFLPLRYLQFLYYTRQASRISFGIFLFFSVWLGLFLYAWTFHYERVKEAGAVVYSWSLGNGTELADFMRKSDHWMRYQPSKFLQRDEGFGVLHYEYVLKEKKEWNDFLKEKAKAENWKLDKGEDGWSIARNGKEIISREQFDLIASGADRVKISPAEARGIYLTGTSASLKNVASYISYAKRNSGNAVVFDVKDVTGFLNYPTNLSDVKSIQKGIRPPVSDLSLLVQKLKKNNIYSIARVALFQDETLARRHPELAIRLKNGTPLLVKGRTVWVDPNLKEVRDYNLRIIWEVLQSGVDEIQLDYVRYPAEGDWKSAHYTGISNHYEKPAVLANFLQQVYTLTSSYGARLSIDVFGVVAWQERLDIKSTGQDMRLLAQAADVLSPMLYPSHFSNGFGGVAFPGDHPYDFIFTGVKKLQDIAGEGKTIRPWLQAFAWRTSNYNSSYIEKQIEATFDRGEGGFLLWNAKNSYLNFTMPESPRKNSALPLDRKAKKKSSG